MPHDPLALDPFRKFHLGIICHADNGRGLRGGANGNRLAVDLSLNDFSFCSVRHRRGKSSKLMRDTKLEMPHPGLYLDHILELPRYQKWRQRIEPCTSAALH
jgi:hypothetical protein